MKQYKINSEHINQDSTDDCYLDPNDPIHELKIIQQLAGLNSHARLQEYKGSQTVNTENMSHTATALKKKERALGLKPGDAEWFKLWFSLPYMTGSVNSKFRNRNK
jgi:hypothetical protein